MQNTDIGQLLGRIDQLETLVKGLTTQMEKHKQEEEQYRNLVEHSNDGICIVQDGIIEYANSKAAILIDCHINSLIKSDFTRFHKKDNMNTVNAMYANFINSKIDSFQVEVPIKRRDGKIRYLELSLSLTNYHLKPAVAVFIRDITKRKKAEDNLIVNENKFRNIFNKANDAIYLWSINPGNIPGKCIEVNDVACRILGYSRKEILQMTPFDLDKTFSVERIPEIMDSLKKEGAKTFEVTQIAKNGEEIPFELNAHIFSLGGNQVILSIARDIRERKKAENMLVEREDRYKNELEKTLLLQTAELDRKKDEMYALLDNLPDIAWLKDLESRFVLVNKPFAQSCGRPVTELKGLTDFDLWPKENAETYYKDDMRVIETGERIKTEEPFTDKDGIESIIETSKGPIRDRQNNIIGTVGIARDITKRKTTEEKLRVHRAQLEELVEERTTELKTANDKLLQEITERQLAEEELKRSEAYFRSIIENVTDGISIANRKGIIFYESPAIKNMLGYTPDELIGSTTFKLLHPEDCEKFTEDFLGLIENNGETLNSLYRYQHSNGSFRILETNIKNLLHNPKINGMIINRRDITERKKLEEQLVHAQKMESLGNLAGSVAHDLNHILTGLVTYPDLILLDIDNTDPLREKIMNIKKSGQRAAAVVEDLLNIARGGMVTKEVMNLNIFLSDFFDSTEIKQVKKNNPKVKLRLKLDGRLNNIDCSKVQVLKVVYNLLINAVDAMPDGGDLLVYTSNKKLKESPLPDEDFIPGKYVELGIKDTGTGIQEEDITKIFEPYYTKKVLGRSGSGIGLTVVWNIVKSHGGHLKIDSEFGKGTDFKIYLPATKEKVIEQTQEPDFDSYIGDSETIMIIDDEENLRISGANILKIFHYTPVVFANGDDGLEYLKNNKVDLILLDMILEEGMDGLKIFIEAKKINPDQKVLIVSGYSASENIQKALDMGAGAFIKKPFTIEEIGSAIKKELERK